MELKIAKLLNSSQAPIVENCFCSAIYLDTNDPLSVSTLQHS